MKSKPSPVSENPLNLNYEYSQVSNLSLESNFEAASSPFQTNSELQHTPLELPQHNEDWWNSPQKQRFPGDSSPNFPRDKLEAQLVSPANQAASLFSVTSPYTDYSAYSSEQAGADRVGPILRANIDRREANLAQQLIRPVQSSDPEDFLSEARLSASPSPMIFNHSCDETLECLETPQNEIKREAQPVEPMLRRPENRLSQLAPTRVEVEEEQLGHASERRMIREETIGTYDSTERLEEDEEEDEDNSLSILNSLPTPRVSSSRTPSRVHSYHTELGPECSTFTTSSLPSRLTDSRRPSVPLTGCSYSELPFFNLSRQPVGPAVGEYAHGSQSTSEGSSKDSFNDSPRLAPQRPRSVMLSGKKRQSYYDFGGSGAPSLINLSLSDAVANEQGPAGMNALLPRMKTIELYRKNAKKSNDPELEFQLAQYMMQTALITSSQRREKGKNARVKSLDASSIEIPGSVGPPDSSESNSAGRASNSSSTKLNESQDVDRIIANMFKDAINSLKRLSEHGHADAQYLLGDIYSSPAVNNTPDMEKSFKYFSMAGKHNHAEAAYRAALCLQEGWGTNRDAGRALQFYRSAAVRNQPGALYQLGMAYFYGGMGLPDNSANRQAGVKWLGRAVNASNATFNRAPYELGKIFEVGYKDLVIPDVTYSAKLYSRSAELGFIPAAARLGRAFEFGELGCPQDPSLSIHYFTIAALGNDPTAQLSMCAWYIVGAGPSFPVNLDEAYEWCLRAALNGLPKAQYTLGYFLENGTGTHRDILEASRWYRKAAGNGYEKAIKRVKELGLIEDQKAKGKCIVM